jgi:hypothetical protein
MFTMIKRCTKAGRSGCTVPCALPYRVLVRTLRKQTIPKRSLPSIGTGNKSNDGFRNRTEILTARFSRSEGIVLRDTQQREHRADGKRVRRVRGATPEKCKLLLRYRARGRENFRQISLSRSWDRGWAMRVERQYDFALFGIGALRVPNVFLLAIVSRTRLFCTGGRAREVYNNNNDNNIRIVR